MGKGEKKAAAAAAAAAEAEAAAAAAAAAAGGDDTVKALSPAVMARVEALAGLQTAFGTANAEYVVAYKALQAKFHAVYTDLWRKRADIVSGAAEAPAAPAAAGAEGAAAAAAGEPKGIEGFWLQALQNGRRTGATIEEHDEPALRFLTDVRLAYLDDFTGFRLEFAFAPNPYFSDALLTKTFHIPFMMGGGRLGSDPTIEKIVGCDINWLPGKNVTEKEVKKVTKKKGKKSTVVKKEPVESFFRFFGTPNMSDDADEEMEPEEVYELNEQIQMEMDVGFEIKNKIIPRAVEWFTGEAVEDDSDDEDDEDEDEEDDDGFDEDEEDEEDEDEEDDEPPPKKGKGGKGGKGKGGKKDVDSEEMAAALADAFKKSLAVKGKKDGAGGGGGGGGGGGDGGAGGGGPGAGGADQPECKQQ